MQPESLKKALSFFGLASLFAVSPILFLFNQNQDHATLSEISRPLIFSLILTIAVSITFSLLLKKRERVLVATIFFLIWFFSFGHLLNLIEKTGLKAIYCQIIFYTAWIAILVLISLILDKLKKYSSDLLRFFLIMGLMLLGASTVNIAFYQLLSKSHPNSDTKEQLTIRAKTPEQTNSDQPDIYYIILDGYARDDILKKYFHYDNSEFTDYLKKKGFFVATESRSNYLQTSLSLSSSLNMRYLKDFAGRQDSNRSALAPLISNSQVRQFLNSRGYQFVNVISGYYLTEIKGADIFITPKINLSEFEIFFLELTPLAPIYHSLLNTNNPTLHQAKVNFAIDKIASPIEGEDPKFIFSHLLIPHPPFVFNENGAIKKVSAKEFTFSDADGYFRETGASIEDYRQRYLGQVKYVNQRIKTTIDKILSRSKQPIIIIQGDHGPGSMLNWANSNLIKESLDERTAILNAYYFPDQNYRNLKPNIGPVNSFRVIFNQYFSSDLPLLPEKQYYSTWSKPFLFQDITDMLNS